MKHFNVAVIALSVTVVAAAAIAQTVDAPGSAASRRQSGKVGPPVDAASTNLPAPVITPPVVPSPAPSANHPAPEPAPPVQEAAPTTPDPKPVLRSGRASRMASGKVTDGSESSGGLPIRPDRN
ncbi:hypothetical protein [Roseateles sp.]|uniref:hypothetical protein n=1 Tax=Roseateles sp. TaxID=1971397 RepID=UPI0031D79458